MAQKGKWSSLHAQIVYNILENKLSLCIFSVSIFAYNSKLVFLVGWLFFGCFFPDLANGKGTILFARHQRKLRPNGAWLWEPSIDPIRVETVEATEVSKLMHGLLLWLHGAACHLLASQHKAQQFDHPAQEPIQSNIRVYLISYGHIHFILFIHKSLDVHSWRYLENVVQGNLCSV